MSTAAKENWHQITLSMRKTRRPLLSSPVVGEVFKTSAMNVSYANEWLREADLSHVI